jgi:predicted alpha/beta hydrolase family esterase
VLVAHSLGCQLVAAWSAHSAAHGTRQGLLVAPPDPERDDMPPHLYNWRPINAGTLASASLVVNSSRPLRQSERVAAMAADQQRLGHGRRAAATSTATRGSATGPKATRCCGRIELAD